jgi:hypothetical protein
LEQRAAHRLIVSRDHVELDALGADGGALADLGATPETLPVVLVDHGQRAGVAFGLALGQQAQGGDFGGQEQRRRAWGHAATQAPQPMQVAASKAGVGLLLRHPVWRGHRGRPRSGADEAPGLDDSVERAGRRPGR